MSPWSPGDVVYDAWWFWKVGVIVRVGKTVVRVRYPDGTETTYDKGHQRFLRHLHGGKHGPR